MLVDQHIAEYGCTNLFDSSKLQMLESENGLTKPMNLLKVYIFLYTYQNKLKNILLRSSEYEIKNKPMLSYKRVKRKN